MKGAVSYLVLKRGLNIAYFLRHRVAVPLACSESSQASFFLSLPSHC